MSLIISLECLTHTIVHLTVSLKKLISCWLRHLCVQLDQRHKSMLRGIEVWGKYFIAERVVGVKRSEQISLHIYIFPTIWNLKKQYGNMTIFDFPPWKILHFLFNPSPYGIDIN